MAAARSSFVWTDEEVELLLRVTLEYKSSKHQEDIDWESCQTKYADIHEAFVRRYPAGKRVEFPHSTEATSRVQLTSKLKAIRGKFRQAVDSGRRNGHGRVVLLYFELCKQIWDGSPDTDALESGLETGDVKCSLRSLSAAMTPRATPLFESVGHGGSLSNENLGSDVSTRRNILQAKLTGHRRDRLKRKVHSDPAVQEDLQIKRRMLELIEESEKYNKAKLDNLSVQMDKMLDSIDEGMSLLRTLMSNSPRPDGSSNIDTDVHIPSSGLKIEIQPAADHCYAGHEEVGCDVCTGRKLKAFKSCLVCLMNYCVKHLQPHCDAATLKVHKLVNPSKKRQQIHQRIQDQEKDVKLLQQEVEAINVSADKAVEDSEEIFTELIHLLQERSSEVKQQIRSQQETKVSRVKDVQEKLEQEITELKRKDAELEQLSITEDHNQFLLNYPSLPALSESTHSSSINIRPLRHFEDVTAAVSELRDKLQDVLRDAWTNILLRVTEEPKTRAELLKYSQEITLDPNIENRDLLLSEGNRKTIIKEEESELWL
ncbi:tripartite motif-containing protein 16-like [Poecilia latipinna]|uniref:tripartite motif-containing protein 16-like n=1 Tax=Poecilia latipinna TaxID=48699 RepID=UPI00072E81C8|nr:PREDICTED: tripartite motif-containing protein 16-like [Poecilia latipinna]